MILQLVLFCLLTSTAFAQEDPLPVQDQGMWQTLIMVGLVFAIFYLILWRPEQKRRKAMQTLRSTLKKGDRVVAMGIIGTIDAIQEDSLILQMVEGAKIEVLKGAVSEVVLEPEKKE